VASVQVIADTSSVKAQLEKNKYFAKPKLALDAVGGHSAVRLADALTEGFPLVRAPPLPSQR
jgi:trans-2-enoyl-CoA reductase